MTDTAEFVDEQQSGSYRATFNFAKNLIAACPTFQEVIIGVHSAAEAAEKIFYQETLAEEHEDLTAEYEGDPGPEMQARPFCVLTDSDRQRRKVGHQVFMGEGSLIACFEVLVPDELKIDYEQDGATVIAEKWERRKLWRIDVAAQIEDDICDLAGRHDTDGEPYLNVVETDLIIPPSDPELAQPQDHIGFAIALVWK